MYRKGRPLNRACRPHSFSFHLHFFTCFLAKRLKKIIHNPPKYKVPLWPRWHTEYTATTNIPLISMWGYFGKLTAGTGRYLFYFIWYGFHLFWYRLVLFFSRYRLYLSRRFQLDGRSSFISIIVKFLIYINSGVPMQLREKHVAQHPCKLSFHPLFMYFISSKWRDNQLFSPVNMVGVPQRGRVACFIKVSVCARMYLSIQTFNRSREKKISVES